MFDRLKSLVTRKPRRQAPQPSDFGPMSNVGVLPGIRVTPPDASMAGLLNAANTMPWLYAVAWKAADGVAEQPWRAFVARKNGKVVSSRTLRQAPFATRQELYVRMKAANELQELDTHPILDLLDAGNAYFPGRQMRAVTQLYTDLVGEAYWLYERNNLGMPIRFWPLPPTWIADLPGPDKDHYRLSFRGWNAHVPATEILRFVKPNPVHPYERGSGIARSLGDELETYEYASKFTKHVFFNQARPDLIISGEGINLENTTRLEQRWTQKLQGFWNAAKPFFVSGKVDVTPIGANFQHLEVIKLREHERDLIIQVFGYPPEIFGINQHSNRSTIAEASYIASRYVVLPRLEFQREFLQKDLVPEFDDRLVIDFVSPIEEDREFQLKVMIAVPAAFSINEVRHIAKHNPLIGPEGDYRVVPNTVRILDQLKPMEAVQQTPQETTPTAQPASGKGIPLNLETLVDTIIKEEVNAMQRKTEVAA